MLVLKSKGRQQQGEEQKEVVKEKESKRTVGH